MFSMEKNVSIKLIKSVLLATRPNFLVLSLVVIAMPVAVAFYEKVNLDLPTTILLFVGAIVAHVAVNLLNEYQDFKSGLDNLTHKTPFSGGSGSLVETPQAAKGVLVLFVISLVIMLLIGLYLVYKAGIGVLLFGLLGIAIIVFYTRFLTRMPWLCLIAPGFAFGPLFVVGSYYVLSGEVTALIVVLSLVTFFLANNLLLLNQIPDLEADKQVGRYNILMHIGVINGLQVFAAFVWFAFISLGMAVWLFDLPSWVNLGFIPLLIAFPMLRNVQESYENVDKLLPALAMNVIINLLTPSLIAIGFVLAVLEA